MSSAIQSHLELANPTLPFQQTLTGKVVLAVAATGLVALCAHTAVPLPFTPVPLTLQTFAVILIGMVLGPVAGFSAMVLYLAEGASGLPVFSPHGPGGVAQLLGPTAGYLFSYPIVAATAGWAVRTLPKAIPALARALSAGAFASIFLFAMGAGWLAHLLHQSTAVTWHLAVAPFLLGEVVKVSAAAGLFATMQRWHKA